MEGAIFVTPFLFLQKVAFLNYDRCKLNARFDKNNQNGKTIPSQYMQSF
jgi:hypothetical protein